MSTYPIQTLRKLAANSLCNQPIEVSLMNTMNAIRFLETLAIPEPQKYEDLTANVASTQMEFTHTATTESVQVNVGSLCSFSEDLSVQNKADVMNSILLAQLAANKAHDRFKYPMNWYSFYTNVLQNVGWNNPSFSFSSTSLKTPINWEDLVLQDFEGLGGMELAKKAIGVAQALTMDSKAMTIWSKNSSNGDNGNFQIMSLMSENATVVATIGGIIFQSTMIQDRFLSWSTNFAIQNAASKFELNEDIYGKIRQQVIDKLGDAPKTNVADVP